MRISVIIHTTREDVAKELAWYVIKEEKGVEIEYEEKELKFTFDYECISLNELEKELMRFIRNLTICCDYTFYLGSVETPSPELSRLLTNELSDVMLEVYE